MQLTAVKSGSLRSCCRLSELLDHKLYLSLSHLMRHHIRTERAGDRRRCPRCISINNTDLTAGMMELDNGKSSPFVESVRIFLEAGYMFIFPKAANILMSLSRNICDSKIFGNDHCKAAFSFCFMVCGKALGAAAVFLTQVHDHSGHDAAVSELSIVNCNRAKQTV